MSIACVLITHFPLKVALLRQPDLRDRPLLIVSQHGSKSVVLDRSPEARDTSVGMPLDLALGRCPYAAIVEADASAYREAWVRILDALGQRSPIIEDADIGLAYVDLRGLDRLYGSQATLLAAVLNSVPQAFRPRVGVAQGKFPAYAAALRAEANSVTRVSVDVAAFLAPFPVSLLPTSWGMKERLTGFGLESMGDVARLPFSAMQGEFGKEGARLWRLANGQDDEPLIPRKHEETVTHETAFAAPTASLSAILVVLESLLLQAFSNPRLRGRFARVVLLQGHVTDKPSWSKRVAFHEPVGDKDRALFTLRSKLEGLTLPGPLETLSLTLSELTGEAGRQESLFRDVRRRAYLDHALRQLQARLGGHAPIYQIREVEPWSRIPERRRALVPYEP